MAKKQTASLEDQLLEAYHDLVVSGERTPHTVTVADLVQKTGAEETEFYKLFSTPQAVGRRLWLRLGEAVKAQLEASDAYKGYSAREKMLAYEFAFFEVAVGRRQFISATHCAQGLTEDHRADFKQVLGDVVQEGIMSGEILDRMNLSGYYVDMLWALHQQLIRFWLHDTSAQFEQTERAIEVLSKVPLELMGRNLLDSLWETLRFRWDNLGWDRWFKH